MNFTRNLRSALLAGLTAVAMTVSASAADLVMPALTDSNVFTAPTLVTPIDDQADVDAIAADLPATAIFRTDDNGNTILADGTVLTTAAESAVFCGNVIPAYEVKTEAAVRATVDNLIAGDIKDYFIIAEDIALLDIAINQNIWSRTVLRVSDTYKNADGSYDLMKIRGDANSVGCHVVILPEEISDRYHADFLERRLIGVWTTAPDTEYGTMKGILSGGNGMITKDVPAAKKAMDDQFEKNTMTRQVLIIGHRGMPGSYPENTLEGSLYAVEAGADIVENDIYITRDGVIVVMHDGDISRTTNGSGNVEDFTLEGLREFIVDTHSEHTDWKIPTLEEYFIEWKKLDKEKQLFVEIKSGKPELIDEFIRLVNEYEIADQVSVITFSQDQLNRLHDAFPQMSVGYLTSGIVSTDTGYNAMFKSIIRTVQKLESTFNHNMDGITKNYVAQLNAHGITHWPWTYRDQTQFISHFLTGINGMTTDYANWAGETVKYCYTGEGLTTTEITLTEGDTLTDVFRTMKYNGTNTAGGDIKIVTGGDVVTADGNSLTAAKAGEAYIYAMYKTAVLNKPIRATSDLIKVTVQPKAADVSADVTEEVSADTAEGTSGTVSAEETPDKTVETGEDGIEYRKVPAVAIVLPIAAVAVIGSVVAFKARRR